MAGSTIVSVKQKLVEELGNQATLSPVHISYAHPGEKARKENLWLGDVRDGEHEPVALKTGRRRREENYELEVHIEVAGTKLKPETSEARAIEIGTVVEEYLADNPKLDATITNLLFIIVTGIDMNTVETTNGPLTHLVLTIAVKARLL